MKTVCVLLSFPRAEGTPTLLSGKPVSSWLAEVLDLALPGVPRVSCGPFATAADLVRGLSRACEGFDVAVVADADAPFLRADLVAECLELHRRYRADYTFADGYPGGFTPEVLRPGILPLLAGWADAKAGVPGRTTLFDLLSTDINRFDVETLLSPVDLRSRRLSFTADSRRNLLLLERYAGETGLPTRGLLDRIDASVPLSRTLPATLHVQLCAGVLQVPAGSPHLGFDPQALTRRDGLSRADWNRLLDRMVAFAGDLTVLPSFWGEPSLHPEVGALLADALAKPRLSLCVETSGLGWKAADLEALAALKSDRIDWIVELDSNNPETYRALRGDGFDEAQAFTRTLLGLFPGRVWPQTTRVEANEDEMESFHKSWKDEAGRVILQKHNDFGGRVPRLKPSDLSPWKRHACWHLARDLAVFADGTTVVCRDDYGRTQPLGNLLTEAPETVWARGEALFGRHAAGDWPEVCRLCDEWYTFHF